MHDLIRKTMFLRGWRCPKSFYLIKHVAGSINPPSFSENPGYRQRYEVEKLARALFPGGIDLTQTYPASAEKRLKKTEKAFQTESEIFYRPAFAANGLFTAADIVLRKNNTIEIFKIKSSTSINKIHIEETAFEFFVINDSGYSIKDVSVIFLNKSYRRKDSIDIHELFRIRSVMDETLKLQDEIAGTAERLKNILASHEMPGIEIGPQCLSPYPCDFKSFCWKDIPDPSVFEIAKMSQSEKFILHEKGKISLADLDEEYIESLLPAQKIQIRASLSGAGYRDPDKIKSFTSSLKYPIQFLDFESIMTAVPEIRNTSPFEPIPFQYSLHVIEKKGAEPVHHEFLAEENILDPRKDFTESLLNTLKTEGCILAYNASYEKMILRKMIEILPQHRILLEKFLSLIIDLALPFRDTYLYEPSMKGSYSIKKLLPALYPEMKYDQLEISDGQSAMNAYIKIRKQPGRTDNSGIRKNLLEYCRMDTFAMIKILEYLEKIN